MQIEDGTGNSYRVEVTDHNMMRTYAMVESEISHQSEVHEKAYSWTASKDIDATDCIIWLRNDSTTEDLIIQTIAISNDTAGTWFIYSPTGTTADGDTITGVNLNRGSGKLAEATCRADATGTTPANYIHYGASQAYQEEIVELHGSVVLGYLDEIAVDLTTEAGVLGQATIIGYYHTSSGH
ncbi:MAG: hypothetical protein GY774_35665 [Planctomycetes bacterium]|nr:hypothetical protein [Planctomycetota bacterium]